MSQREASAAAAAPAGGAATDLDRSLIRPITLFDISASLWP